MGVVAELEEAPLPPAKELDSVAADIPGPGTSLRPVLSAVAALGFLVTVTLWGLRRRTADRAAYRCPPANRSRAGSDERQPLLAMTVPSSFA